MELDDLMLKFDSYEDVIGRCQGIQLRMLDLGKMHTELSYIDEIMHSIKYIRKS